MNTYTVYMYISTICKKHSMLINPVLKYPLKMPHLMRHLLTPPWAFGTSREQGTLERQSNGDCNKKWRAAISRSHFGIKIILKNKQPSITQGSNISDWPNIEAGMPTGKWSAALSSASPTMATGSLAKPGIYLHNHTYSRRL